MENVVEGYNGTMFAYGQTGCGKTYTMIGCPTDPGIIPRAFQHIVNIINTSDQSKKYVIRCSFLEIYNEDVHDLLSYDSKCKLELKESLENGVFVKGLS